MYFVEFIAKSFLVNFTRSSPIGLLPGDVDSTQYTYWALRQSHTLVHGPPNTDPLRNNGEK